jgi:hypothetical protein
MHEYSVKTWNKTASNLLKPSGKYMPHLLKQSIILHLFIYVSYNSHCKQGLLP